EARIMSQLDHPNVVKIYAADVHNGLPMQALELLDAGDLESRLARATAPAPIALHIVREIAQALEYVHRAKGADGRPLSIVHRDVSPENILLSSSGEVK